CVGSVHLLPLSLHSPGRTGARFENGDPGPGAPGPCLVGVCKGPPPIHLARVSGFHHSISHLLLVVASLVQLRPESRTIGIDPGRRRAAASGVERRSGSGVKGICPGRCHWRGQWPNGFLPEPGAALATRLALARSDSATPLSRNPAVRRKRAHDISDGFY